ncbi:4-hydroxy-tetrahydrodipicolinate reductase [candidate division WOR-3 bacterium]|nr:4-hydroxy-tetrahydrodipicolinate reductase [candidate division WOR-3 bacterium]
MIRVAVAGGAGRMAGDVARMVAEAPDMELSSILERDDHPDIGKVCHGAEITSDLAGFLEKTDVVVEFTSPRGLVYILEKIKNSPLPLVSGTTGLSEGEFEKLTQAAKQRAVFWAPNMSLGVNLLFKLAAKVAKALPDYDVEIVEMHHRHKKDAPSGTAKKLAEIVSGSREVSKTIYGREGHTGERSPDELAVFALRGGDVAGEHTLYFVTEGERIELTHRASSRMAFAKGCLKAIRFIVNKPEGFYDYAALLEDN